MDLFLELLDCKLEWLRSVKDPCVPHCDQVTEYVIPTIYQRLLITVGSKIYGVSSLLRLIFKIFVSFSWH